MLVIAKFVNLFLNYVVVCAKNDSLCTVLYAKCRSRNKIFTKYRKGKFVHMYSNMENVQNIAGCVCKRWLYVHVLDVLLFTNWHSVLKT